jgi:hypothetical protein
MEQEEIVELTKPKRSNRKKTTPQPEQEVPVDVVTPPATAVKRTRKPKAEPIPEPIQEQEEPQEIVQTNIQDDPDYKLFLQYAEELAKPAMPAKPKRQPKKSPVQEPVPTPPPVAVKAKTPKKQVAPQTAPPQQQDDIYELINNIKGTIADTKVKKTKSQNEFLREQLAFLQSELEELRQTDMPKNAGRVKQTKQHTVRIPKDRIEIIAKGAPEIPKQLPLRDIINSFGF